MAVQIGDGSLKKALQKPADVSSLLNTANVLVSSGESPKPTITAAKAGISFVIPKNKLSGALVPVVRSVTGKWDPIDVKREEDSKSVVPQRRTRWGTDLTQDPAVKRGRALALQTRAEQIAAQLESGQLDIDTNEAIRSPSPPPIYDSNGQRTNTREGRKREQLELERREAIGMDQTHLDDRYDWYQSGLSRITRNLMVKDYPGYNFIGLILGPRGNTQKRMEAETGSRIAIRGKGAVKEGKKSNAARLQGGRRDGKDAEGAFEDLHVHITADSVEKVDAAVALVEPLLTPVDEDRNTHKRKQLRELAEMNGTMRDFSKACSICGETGHREWHCAKNKLVTYQAKVDCQICGDGGHPTIDCLRKPAGQGKVLDREYLSFLEELGDGLAGPTALAAPGFSSKSGGEDSIRQSSQPGPTLTATRLDDAPTGSDTSLDPNQLVDVINRPHPSIMGLNQPQHIPLAWSPGNAFTNSCEGRASLQQGGHAQSEGDRPFSGMFQIHPAQCGFNVPCSSFAHPVFSHASGPITYQGRPSSAMALNMGGLPAPQHFHAGPDGVPNHRNHFFADNEAGPGSLTCPIPHNSGHLRMSNSAPPETSKGLGSPWNQTVSSPLVGVDKGPMVWETNHLPRPPPATWKRGLASQLAPWQMAREQGWKEKPPAIPPPSSSQSTSPPWEVTHKPWEVNLPWNGPSLPTQVHQPWQSTQQGPFHSYTQPTAPNPGPGAFVWRGGPAPQSVRMALPNQSENLPSQANPPHMDPFPPWHSLSQPVAESSKFPITPGASQASQSGGVFIPQPLTPATWSQQRGDDLCAPDPPKPSNTERDGSQSISKVVFTPKSEAQESSSLSVQSQVQVVGSTPTGFASFPKTGWSQLGADIVRPPWESSASPGQDSKPAPTTTAPGSPVEVDAEYEKLMASVGVT